MNLKDLDEYLFIIQTIIQNKLTCSVGNLSNTYIYNQHY